MEAVAGTGKATTEDQEAKVRRHDRGPSNSWRAPKRSLVAPIRRRRFSIQFLIIGSPPTAILWKKQQQRLTAPGGGTNTATMHGDGASGKRKALCAASSSPACMREPKFVHDETRCPAAVRSCIGLWWSQLVAGAVDAYHRPRTDTLPFPPLSLTLMNAALQVGGSAKVATDSGSARESVQT